MLTINQYRQEQCLELVLLSRGPSSSSAALLLGNLLELGLALLALLLVLLRLSIGFARCVHEIGVDV